MIECTSCKKLHMGITGDYCPSCKPERDKIQNLINKAEKERENKERM